MLQEHRAVAARRHARRFAAATGAAALAVGVAVASAQGDAAPAQPGVAAPGPGQPPDQPQRLRAGRHHRRQHAVAAGMPRARPARPASAGGAYPRSSTTTSSTAASA